MTGLNIYLVYAILIAIAALVVETGIFIFLRKYDKERIESLTKAVKEARAKALQHEVSRMALVRQNDERLLIIRKLEEKIKKIKGNTLNENIREL